MSARLGNRRAETGLTWIADSLLYEPLSGIGGYVRRRRIDFCLNNRTGPCCGTGPNNITKAPGWNCLCNSIQGLLFIFSSIRPAWKPDINLKTSYPAFVRPDLNCCREPGGSSALPCINALVINIKMDLIPFGNSATRGVVFRSEFECLDDGLALSRQTTGLPLTRIPTAAVTWRVRGYIP